MSTVRSSGLSPTWMTVRRELPRVIAYPMWGCAVGERVLQTHSHRGMHVRVVDPAHQWDRSTWS